jgi:hypothetical protein
MLEDVQRMIDALQRADRAMLRPWMLAHYDEMGNGQSGYRAPKK